MVYHLLAMKRERDKVGDVLACDREFKEYG
jgi:hypothetical protein